MKTTQQPICNCDHHSPPMRVMRSTDFNHGLARKIANLDLSGDATVDLVLTELLDHHAGRLIGPDGKQIVLDSDDPTDIERFDSLFSEDQRRFVNRYKARAAEAFKYRLQVRLIDTVAMMFLALEVRECRLSGRCANNGETA